MRAGLFESAKSFHFLAMKTPRLLLVLFSVFIGAPFLHADGAADNLPLNVRRVPPPGIKIAEEDRAELVTRAAELGQKIESLRSELKAKTALLELLPDIEIYHKAVHWALSYDEFFKSNEVKVARALLQQGMERAELLREGRAPWLSATGLVARGYLSRIDGSVQPYGLVVPASYHSSSANRFRLDCWFHGRGETLSELDFIVGRERSVGEFAPPNAFVLHLYGRYCNANRFAGETDLFETLDQVRKYYPIDENRLVVRGFSMGGAACWDFAAHHAGLWAAAAPGAGFSETADFLKVFQNEILRPAWYEQKLWHLYDATDYALNLFNCPTVAYSGEIDKQKQAADLMAMALMAEGLELAHIIGPKTAHAYHPMAKAEVNRRINSIADQGRNPVPQKIRFTTWTLKYNQMLWLTVDSLEEHWERARVEAEWDASSGSIQVATTNVSALSFSFAPGLYPLDTTRAPKVLLDGQKLEGAKPLSDRSWTSHFQKKSGAWLAITPVDLQQEPLRKRHDLQGPIDDAFMDSFIMVRPTGSALNEKVGAWAAAELAHATNHWRQQFRGEPRVKDDAEISAEEIDSSNLVLWGDPASNKLLRQIANKLPIHWNESEINLGKKTFSSTHHVPVLIYPNPLNPRRYIVLNSGFTFREYDYLNNARQTPKLPDYAIIDVDVPVSSRAPGAVTSAGFFTEQWELRDSAN